MSQSHIQTVETEEAGRQTSQEETHSQQDTQETTLPDVEAVGRLLTDRRLRTRKGAVVWGWTALTPISVWNLIYGDMEWSVIGAFSLVTTITLHRLAAAVDCTQVVLQTNLDKQWVGALVDASEWPNLRIRGIAKSYLVRLLPTLTEADDALLDQAQRASLYARLLPRMAAMKPPLTYAILKAVAQIGDSEAIPYVSQLAQMTAFSFRRADIRQAARACLPALERRVLQQRLAPVPEELQTSHTTTEETTRTPEQQRLDSHIEVQLKTLEIDCQKAQPGMRLSFLLASWGVIVPYTVIQAILGYLQNSWPQTLLFSGLALGATQLHRLTLNPSHRKMARFLAGLDNVQAVGPLSEALDWPDAQIQRVASDALTQLLPRLHTGDGALLTTRQRDALYRRLTVANAKTQSKFLLALLKALEQIGDPPALFYVETLLKNLKNRPLTSQQKKVYAAAQDCLPYLKEQARQDQYSQTLLRASSVSDIPTETLLRPAFGSPGGETAHLLRVNTTENIETT